jgi:two-component system NtrC family sensor kinase
MTRRISTQIIVAVGVVSAVTIAVPTALVVRAHRASLLAERTHHAHQIADTITRSTHYDMLENRRDNLQRQIDAIGRQEGIVGVRLFNKEGRVVFSSDPLDIGRTVDKRSESCVACHANGPPSPSLPAAQRSRIFTDRDGRRVLGVIHPIPNEPTCATACHAHRASDTVLGVLDVDLSLADIEDTVERGQVRTAALAVVVITASSLVLWALSRRLVVAPVEALAAATRRVASGDLSAEVPVRGRNELADLARSWNDMTRRLSEAQRQLTHADKMAAVGRLSAGLAHEINNPLTAVLTYASFWQSRSGDNAALREDLDVIVRETKRCRDIVRGLLDFARPSAPVQRPVALGDVVGRAAAVVAHPLALSRIELSLGPTADLPLVKADPNQIQQVLVNLLMNAADAVAADGTGRITVTTRSANGHVEIDVEDNGCGIPDEIRAHLFEPFFSTKGPRGTGLGLSISWGIVKAHGGAIEVSSEPGRGSRFTVRLPAKGEEVT